MYKCTNKECGYKLDDAHAEYAPPTITKNKICPLCGERIKYTNELVGQYKKYKRSFK